MLMLKTKANLNERNIKKTKGKIRVVDVSNNNTPQKQNVERNYFLTSTGIFFYSIFPGAVTAFLA